MPEIDGIETARKIREMNLLYPPLMVIVTAYGREEVIMEAENAGIDEVLIKPVSASILFDTVMHLLGSKRKEQRENEDLTESRNEIHFSMNGVKILLVEDNEINQEVATEILSSAGCIVSIAANGEEAISKVKTAPFDIVLMDVQMPVMDGITATREIRKLPGFNSLPIIAMTANAMQEDRTRCFDAGMNDYITKPIDPNVLFQTLQRYFKSDTFTVVQVRDNEIPFISGIDTVSGLKRVAGNKKLYFDLLDRFSKEHCGSAESIKEAFLGGNHVLSERIAHTLKGVSGNIGALEVQAAAEELEASINSRKTKTVILEILKRLDSLLYGLKEDISSAIDGVSKEKPVEPVKDKPEQFYREILYKLKNYAEESDSETLDYFEAVFDDLVAYYGRERSEKLQKAVRAYDFGTALDAIKGISDLSDK